VPFAHRLHPSYSHPLLAEYQNQTPITAASLVYPIFVTSDPDAKEEIASLPNQYRWGLNRIDELIQPLVQKGLRAVLIFGVLSAKQSQLKDGRGSPATTPENPVAGVLSHLRRRYPALLLMTDVCLCAYTDHGHCGLVNADGSIDNDASIARLAEARRAACCDDRFGADLFFVLVLVPRRSLPSTPSTVLRWLRPPT